MAPGVLGLRREGRHAPLQFDQHVLQPVEVILGGVEPSLGLVATVRKTRDACGLGDVFQ